MSDIRIRKKEHVELTVSDSTQYSTNTGFDRYIFSHNALPEINLDQVSTEAELLDRTFSMPLLVSSMTGGYAEAGPVNAIIASYCEENNIPFGVGSQRAMIEDESLTHTFSVVRKEAPNAFICSNIGGAQLIGGLNVNSLRLLVESIEANAIIVHLNPLQELMQPEGDQSFYGILNGIESLITDSQLPIIVKETGAGISKEVAIRLLNIGVKVIDVAGAGGTSWSKVENQRITNQSPNQEFDDWGIPTVDCITQIQQLLETKNFELVASGGVRNASDMLKSLCLGATFTATAQPIIKAINENGYDGLETLMSTIQKNLTIGMTLLGCSTINELNSSHLIPK